MSRPKQKNMKINVLCVHCQALIMTVPSEDCPKCKRIWFKEDL